MKIFSCLLVDWRTARRPEECRAAPKIAIPPYGSLRRSTAFSFKGEALNLNDSVIEEIYTKAELERITMGLIPQSMDDKWFIFYEEPWLYLHRSWTGLCIFKVCFEVVDEYAAVTEAWVNREPGERCGNMDIVEEKFLLEILLDCRAGRYEDAKSKTLNDIQRKKLMAK
ncbi:MAG: hypothetical protein WBA93_18525 [Microcoleaceae cyanobacterium]